MQFKVSGPPDRKSQHVPAGVPAAATNTSSMSLYILHKIIFRNLR